MRFRGKITDLGCVRQFAQLLHILSKCSQRFVLRINPEKLIFVLGEKDIRTNGAGVWCEVPKDAYFSDYKVEGVSADDNQICIGISSEMLATKLGSLKSSNSVISMKIKLTNKVAPCLTFEIASESVKSNTICLHDIPVTIYTRSHWKDYEEPETPSFDISLAMPDLKIVRTALERIRACGPRVAVTATNEGDVIFSIDNYSVTSTVKFSNLRIYETDDDLENLPSTARPRSIGGKTKRLCPNNDDDDEGFRVPSTASRVEVDTKHLLQLIPAEDVKPDNFIFSLIEGHMVHLLYIYGEITIQYYIPGIV